MKNHLSWHDLSSPWFGVEVEQYQVDIVDQVDHHMVTTTRWFWSKHLDSGWTLSFSGVTQNERSRVGGGAQVPDWTLVPHWWSRVKKHKCGRNPGRPWRRTSSHQEVLENYFLARSVRAQEVTKWQGARWEWDLPWDAKGFGQSWLRRLFAWRCCL